MGNESSVVETSVSSKNKSITKLFTKKKSKYSSTEQYIIELYKSQKYQYFTSTDIDVQKRTVFVSLNGLWQTWQTVPSHILYSSILILPLSKKWIYNLKQYEKEISSHFVSMISSFQSGIFIQVIRVSVIWRSHIVWYL